MASRRRPTSELSRGGRFYRSHQKIERKRKENELARWKSSHSAFKDVNPDFTGTLREFRDLARERGWSVPNHSARHRAPEPVVKARRRFVEEGLNRHYDAETYSTLYPT
jgi:hypothetical protein